MRTMEVYCFGVVAITMMTTQSIAFRPIEYRSLLPTQDVSSYYRSSNVNHFLSYRAVSHVTYLSSGENAKSNNELAIANKGPSIEKILDNMPVAEKYSILLQSYASNIMDNTNRTAAAMSTMEALYMEMLTSSVTPTVKSSKLLIDAASTFSNSIKLGKSLQLSKAGEMSLKLLYVVCVKYILNIYLFAICY